MNEDFTTQESSRTFGERDKFAIHYRTYPDKYNYSPNDKMAICHLVINDNLIGRPDEECYLPTWFFRLTEMRNRIANSKELLFPKEFEGLTNREIVETILKANQLEEEFHPDFLYLPQLPNEIWSTHSFNLDETLDGYLFYFYVKDQQITFLVEDETGSLNNDYRSGKFLFYTISLEQFVKTVDEATAYLVERYPYLKENVSTRILNTN